MSCSFRAEQTWMFAVVCLCLVTVATAMGDEIADVLKRIDPNIIDANGRTDEERKSLRRSLIDDVYGRLREVNRRDIAAWRQVQTREDWERLRDERIDRLRRSLGNWPAPPERVAIRTTRQIDGDGYRIDNIVFESRPDLWVTANLYQPAKTRGKMPGILICPSHHNPKTQGELQDMGMTWARQGCCVLVIDNLGHGERRQHPFRTREDFAGEFAVGRQDYHFRYNVGLQLHLVGESLIGWMVWDLMRGVDVLLAHSEVDSQKIILLGSVAGGGDPAAVTAALDSRIACVAPFNFGGPQPETRLPLPDDADLSFDYVGGGGWESTRNLRLSARDGFLPWTIVASVAPRRLIYAHEFSWDQEHDPVWRRLNKIFGFYSQTENLDFTHGFGQLSGQPPAASHCNNIGPPHRQRIHAALARWFDMPAPEEEAHDRRDPRELLCLEGADAGGIQLTPFCELTARTADQQAAAVRAERSGVSAPERRILLRKRWTDILGNCEPWENVKAVESSISKAGPIEIERFVLQVDRGMRLPALVLSPKNDHDAPRSIVVGVAQGGKAGFLQQRSQAIASLLAANIAVCLLDVRGSGETSVGDSRGRRSDATSVSSSDLMLGTPQVGEQLRDLRSLIAHLRKRSTLKNGRIALWGDSFAPWNEPKVDDAALRVPLDVSQPPHSEPLGPMLAMVAALYEEDICAVAAPRGGLFSFRSVLESRFCHLPHDVVIPGVCSTGDLPELAAALQPCPLLLAGMIDGLNRPVGEADCDRVYALALGGPDKQPPATQHARSIIGVGDYFSNVGQRSLAEWLINAVPARRASKDAAGRRRLTAFARDSAP